ncbi:hypothetical protein FS749_008001 [Ceratobasidium sp. UAMH 11750]|nr:hypothetical protein FS749_008001 [Ceratobasidium sp. UAMH 11750]
MPAVLSKPVRDISTCGAGTDDEEVVVVSKTIGGPPAVPMRPPKCAHADSSS